MEKEITRKRLEIVEKVKNSRLKVFEKKDKIIRSPLGNEKEKIEEVKERGEEIGKKGGGYKNDV